MTDLRSLVVRCLSDLRRSVLELRNPASCWRDEFTAVGAACSESGVWFVGAWGDWGVALPYPYGRDATFHRAGAIVNGFFASAFEYRVYSEENVLVFQHVVKKMKPFENMTVFASSSLSVNDWLRSGYQLRDVYIASGIAHYVLEWAGLLMQVEWL